MLSFRIKPRVPLWRPGTPELGAWFLPRGPPSVPPDPDRCYDLCFLWSHLFVIPLELYIILSNVLFHLVTPSLLYNEAKMDGRKEDWKGEGMEEWRSGWEEVWKERRLNE